MSGKARVRRIKKRSTIEAILALPAPDLDKLKGCEVVIRIDEKGRLSYVRRAAD